ncbi:hypothetical protein OZN62_00010 [Aurantiacibacter sp. MUD11]|uniref:hypothetical protein n=1 Tax=Aurantiacibacter sp. MUD11 TaxID=3003265 RepID=UPI0022AB3FF3|nr:hypothetical protein [Aurantiacibacter sp. MUD11]WAT17998.1 hypothetical protein OZN62_00010 [Aurantiacibacter sp. MUD11]
MAVSAMAFAMVATGCSEARASGEAAGHPSPPACTATGAEVLTPPMSDVAACDAFVLALDEALAEQGDVDVPAITVDLRFSANGVARAEVRHVGEANTWFDANVAMMDRPLDRAAIDRLAAYVVQRIREDSDGDGDGNA